LSDRIKSDGVVHRRRGDGQLRRSTEQLSDFQQLDQSVASLLETSADFTKTHSHQPSSFEFAHLLMKKCQQNEPLTRSANPLPGNRRHLR
jgi:hypothetical protein